jgi:hypothetical protein
VYANALPSTAPQGPNKSLTPSRNRLSLLIYLSYRSIACPLNWTPVASAGHDEVMVRDRNLLSNNDHQTAKPSQ